MNLEIENVNLSSRQTRSTVTEKVLDCMKVWMSLIASLVFCNIPIKSDSHTCQFNNDSKVLHLMALV